MFTFLGALEICISAPLDQAVGGMDAGVGYHLFLPQSSIVAEYITLTAVSSDVPSPWAPKSMTETMDFSKTLIQRPVLTPVTAIVEPPSSVAV